MPISDGLWMEQVARNLIDDFSGFLRWKRFVDPRKLIERSTHRKVLAGGRGLDVISHLGVLDDAVEAQLLVGAAVGEVDQIESQGPGTDVVGAVGQRDPPVDLRCRQPPTQLKRDRLGRPVDIPTV